MRHLCYLDFNYLSIIAALTFTLITIDEEKDLSNLYFNYIMWHLSCLYFNYLSVKCVTSFTYTLITFLLYVSLVLPSL